MPGVGQLSLWCVPYLELHLLRVQLADLIEYLEVAGKRLFMLPPLILSYAAILLHTADTAVGVHEVRERIRKLLFEPVFIVVFGCDYSVSACHGDAYAASVASNSPTARTIALTISGLTIEKQTRQRQ